MKRFLLKGLLTMPAAALSLFFLSLPVSAAETPDTTPPTIGLVSPETFAVNRLITVQAEIQDPSGFNNCHLFINGTDAGTMRIAAGQASMTQVFTTLESRRLQIRCQDAAGNIGLSAVTESRAEAPDASAPGVLPVGFSVGMVVRLSCLPGERDDEHCHALYYVGKDAKRHAFQSSAAYASWYPTGARVMNISLAALSSLQLGLPISVKPGQSAIRFLSQPTVYAVGEKKTLRPFADVGLVAQALGSDWSSRVDVLTDAFYVNFTFGTEVKTSAEIVSNITSPDETIAG